MEVTVRRILKLLTLFSMILVFCPMFLVSCSEMEVDISVMTAVRGEELYGETIMEPHPFMLICILIPVVALVALFLKNISDKLISLIVAICSAAEMIILACFCLTVRSSALKNMCEFKTTAWFWIDLILLIALIVLNVSILAGEIKMDFDVAQIFSDELPQNSSQITKKEKCFCTQCGKEIDADSEFCEYCGKKVIKQ